MRRAEVRVPCKSGAWPADRGSSGAPTRGSMPSKGPSSKYNQCNINMLANQEPKASALFWYTQRYHTLGVMLRGPRTAIPYKENLRGPCRDRRRLIRFVRVCSTDRGWCVADCGPWAGFLGNGSRLKDTDMRLTVSISRDTHLFTLACQCRPSLIPLRGLRLYFKGVTRRQCVRMYSLPTLAAFGHE